MFRFGVIITLEKKMKKYISLAIMLNLLSGKRYSAPALAEKHETSVKTIYRCIDSLIMAGMPIVSIAGKNGGFELAKDSLLYSSFLTTKELALSLGFLKSSKELVGSNDFSVEEKLENCKDKNLKNLLLKESEELVIDTQTWGSTAKENTKIETIKDAISSETRLKIDYMAQPRTIEPYTLVFKAGAWYVYAFCLRRGSFRLFKVSRIKNLATTDEKFTRKNINLLEKPWNNDFSKSFENIVINLECKSDIASDILEWLDGGRVIKTSGDMVMISSKASFSLGLVHRLMECGNSVRVVSPEKLRLALVSECTKIANEYAKTSV